MKIRSAGIQDTEGIMRLLKQVNNVHSEGRPDLFLPDKTKYTKEELGEILQNDTTPVFVAVDEEECVLGYSFGVFQSHVKDNNFPDIVTYYIDDLCVDERFRGQHIGKALFDFTVDFARKKGCYNITLNVWEKNESAKRFYAGCGLQTQKTGLEMIL